VIARGYRGPGGANPMLLIALVLLVLYFLSGSLQSPIQNATRQPVAFVAFVIAIILGITVHEFMHAYAAHRLGDDTGRLMGRMSLNPMAHLDIFGSFLLVIAGFGYGKPVPVNEARLRGGRTSWALVAVAGPLTNLALALLCALPIRLGAQDLLGGDYFAILGAIVFYNLVLCFFNLVPIPPLDGSRVVYALLPPQQAYTWRTFEAYGPLILMLIFFFAFRILAAIVFTPANALTVFLLGGRI